MGRELPPPNKQGGDKGPTPRDKTEDTTFDHARGENIVHEHVDTQNEDLIEKLREKRGANMEEEGATRLIDHRRWVIVLRNWSYGEEHNVVRREVTVSVHQETSTENVVDQEISTPSHHKTIVPPHDRQTPSDHNLSPDHCDHEPSSCTRKVEDLIAQDFLEFTIGQEGMDLRTVESINVILDSFNCEDDIMTGTLVPFIPLQALIVSEFNLAEQYFLRLVC